jgi:asparagine synthase (glutamine-hydrolysing)
MDRALWEAARARGVRLILSGEGGDHMASYQGNNSLSRLIRQGKWRKAFRLAQQLSHVEGKPLGRILKSHIVKPLLPPWLAYYYYRFKRGKEIKERPFNSAVNPDLAAAYGITETMANRPRYTTPNYPARIVEKLKYGRLAIEDQYIRMSHFQLNGVYPYFDKRIVEFCLGVPPEQFVAGGWKRSLIRRAMAGILPPAIQWRLDKNTYSPDFHRRLITVKPEMIRFLDAIEQNDPVLQYIDIDCIKTQFERLRPAKARTDWDSLTPGIVCKGIIFIKFLQWLKEQKR